MNAALFCGHCSSAMQLNAKGTRLACPNLCRGIKAGRGRSDGSAPATKKTRLKRPLTEAQKAIKKLYAPPRRSERGGGGGGLLVTQDIPESTIQENIMRTLFDAGWLVVRINSGSMKMSGGGFLRAYRVFGMEECDASAGMPDVVAFKGRRALLIEVKDRLGQLRDTQVRFIEHAQKFGVKVELCRSWEEAKRLVDEIAASDAAKPTRARWLALLATERVARRELGEQRLSDLVASELDPTGGGELGDKKKKGEASVAQSGGFKEL